MPQIKKLLPLVQLLPAAAVAAAVLITVPRTVPILADVPERLSAVIAPAVEAAEPTEAEEAEPALPKLPYADGVYTGKSRGYGGSVKVQVTMADGYITDVQIVDASHETKAFLKRAKRLLNTVLDSQTWEVDAVSEATYTSRGILGAIQNALTGEEVVNPLPPQPKPAEPLVAEEFTAPSAYRDGVYTASAEGFGGPITVQVTVAADAITDITVVSAADETPEYFSRASHVITRVLEAGTPDVDAVSGATYSSTGILNAVKSALKTAAIDAPAETEAPVEAPTEAPAETQPETPAPLYADGVYTGTSGNVTVQVTVTGGQIADVAVQDSEDAPADFFAELWAGIEEWFMGSSASSQTPAYTEQELAAAVQAALQQSAQPTEPAPESAAASPAPESAPAEQPADSTKQPAAAPEQTVPESAPAASQPTVSEPAASQPTADSAAPTPLYRDGSYTAVAVCTDEYEFHYDIRVTVVVSGGIITDVQVVAENDTSEAPEANQRYFDRAKNGRTGLSVPAPGLIEQILQKQSADGVDMVSGATYSSQALQSAATQALAQAK